MTATAATEEVIEFDQRDFRNALGTFGTGVTVITTRDDSGKLYGVTVSSFNSVSLAPPLILWSQSRSAPSNPVFQRAPHFVVNVLAAHQSDLSNRFARFSEDKFDGVDYSCTEDGLPVLAGTAGHFLCRNEYQLYGGDHTIFLARVLSFNHETDTRPLFFWRGQYLRP
jgi:3-hydroxy-9,10-secoandrosta-1,3,5(10)-triene-9,17-dione monooxygenase reductase component